MVSQPSARGEGGVAALLAGARAQIERLTPVEAFNRIDDGTAVLVDIRPHAQRVAEGDVHPSTGVRVVERNVLEWRYDASSGAAFPEADPALEVIVLCQEGYTSSLAAFALRQMGVHAAADVAGGYAAWRSAGLPTSPPGSAVAALGIPESEGA